MYMHMCLYVFVCIYVYAYVYMYMHMYIWCMYSANVNPPLTETWIFHRWPFDSASLPPWHGRAACSEWDLMTGKTTANLEVSHTFFFIEWTRWNIHLLSSNRLRKIVSPVHKNGNDAAPREPVQKSFSTPHPFIRSFPASTKTLNPNRTPSNPNRDKPLIPWFVANSADSIAWSNLPKILWCRVCFYLYIDTCFWNFDRCWRSCFIMLLLRRTTLTLDPLKSLPIISSSLQHLLFVKQRVSSSHQLSQYRGIDCLFVKQSANIPWLDTKRTSELAFNPSLIRRHYCCLMFTATRNCCASQDIIHGSAIRDNVCLSLPLQNFLRTAPFTAWVRQPCPHHPEPQQTIHRVEVAKSCFST